ncbi:MAG: LysM peptidoglycan-binding domain-containing protein [Acidobacteriota bacterium]
MKSITLGVSVHRDVCKLIAVVGGGLLLLPACSSRRADSPELTSNPTSLSSAERVADTSTIDESLIVAMPQEDPIDLLIQEATERFEEGEEFFEAGLLQEARPHFKGALDTLKNSEFDFFLNPDLEKAYYGVLKKIQDLELQVWIDPSEIQPPLISTPLDEIGDLNLFAIQVDLSLREKVSQDLLDARFDIPVVVNDYVLRLLNYYQTRGRKVMEEGMRRSGKYMPLFREIFREEGVPESMIYMAQVESNFKPSAYSRAGARGIWQFMVGTGRVYGLKRDWWIDERADIVKSTRAAAQHLNDLYEDLGDWNLVMASYNAGINRILRNQRRYGSIDYWTMVKRRLLPRETRNFVPSILAAIIVYQNPELYGFHVQPDDPIEFETVRVEDQVALQVISEELNVPLGELMGLNPELRRGITPFDDAEYELKVPPGKGDLLRERLAALPPEKKAQFEHHKVRRGETLSVISQRYSSSIQAIAQVNRIRNVHRLREGQDLMIPLSGTFSGVSFSRASRQAPDNYVVRRGDSLYRIASLYGVRIRDLLRWNKLKASGVIYPGQTIRILAQTESTGQGATLTNTGDR